MTALYPLIAAVLQAGSFTLDKAVLNLRRIDFRRYTLISFPLIAFFTGIAWLVVRPTTPFSALLAGWVPWILLGTAVSHVITNILFYRALQHDALNEMELWQLFHKVPVIIVAGFLFADERNWVILALSLIASLAVVWSHTNHHRLVIRRRTAPYIFWIIVMAPIGAALSKILLQTLDPITMELARGVPIAFAFYFLFRKAWKPPGAASWSLLVMTNLLTTTAWLLFFYGYQRLGIVQTLLLFSLQPLLVYLFSFIFLHERFIPKRFIGFIVVLTCIVAAQLLQ